MMSEQDKTLLQLDEEMQKIQRRIYSLGDLLDMGYHCYQVYAYWTRKLALLWEQHDNLCVKP